MSGFFKQQWTFCGVMAVPGFALLLVNDRSKSTRAMVAYDDAHPIKITRLS